MFIINIEVYDTRIALHREIIYLLYCSYSLLNTCCTYRRSYTITPLRTDIIQARTAHGRARTLACACHGRTDVPRICHGHFLWPAAFRTMLWDADTLATYATRRNHSVPSICTTDAPAGGQGIGLLSEPRWDWWRTTAAGLIPMLLVAVCRTSTDCTVRPLPPFHSRSLVIFVFCIGRHSYSRCSSAHHRSMSKAGNRAFAYGIQSRLKLVRQRRWL